MKYDKDTIDAFTRFIESGKTADYNLLAEKYPELIFFSRAVLGDDKSWMWLVNEKHAALAALVKAIENENKSFEYLMKNKMPYWAAVASVVKRDATAETWLRKNNLEQYANLAIAIRTKIDENTPSDFAAFYKGPFS